MSLFNRRRSVIALNDDAIDSIKQELHSLLEVAASFDRIASNTNGAVISLEGRIRADLLAFVLYLDGIDRGTDPAEIAVVNKIFDIDLWHEDFAMYSQDVASKLFENTVPPSILILSEMGKVLQTETSRSTDGETASQVASRNGVSDISRELGNGLVNLYALIGSAFISADGTVTRRESEDLIRYVVMTSRAVNGADAPLPKGAAQHTYDAHVRLFGRKPKI